VALVEGPQERGQATADWTLSSAAELIEGFTVRESHPHHFLRVLRGEGFSCHQRIRLAIERHETAMGHWKHVSWQRNG